MPIYGYRCDACEVDFDVRKSVSDYDTPEACPECEGDTRKLIVPVGFILSGDGFPGKNNRIQGQMRERRAEAGRRQEEKVRDGSAMGGKLVPNVGGERTESWAEAGRLAKSKGKDTTGYEVQAAKEKSLTKRTTSKTN